MNYKENILNLFEQKQLVTVCAPMVRYSKLQFRTLVREYNCDLCYTPMIMADSFCRSGKARDNEFTTNLEDSPVIVQFAANTVHEFVGAAYMVSPYCNGVDLNCCCPQNWAKQLGIGCEMLNHPELISDLVRQCRNQVLKPFTVSVKLGVLKDDRRTIETCRQVEKAGIDFLAVQARIPTQSVRAIDTNILKLIVENVHCPVIGNGGVQTFDDCLNLQKETSCNGSQSIV
uniref:DUS-like FMN-binding domain-containing protein n=1 Tax=Photinus pyralis TaxID=7054 RepID=A0A1Y1L495_PHOPY